MKKFLLITISLILVFFFFSRIKEDWQRYQLLSGEVRSLEQKKINLEEEQKKLKQLLEEGRQEEVLEKEARLMLGLKKKGEKVVMILPPKDFSDISEVSVSTSSKSLSKGYFNSILSKISQIWYDIIEKLKIKN